MISQRAPPQLLPCFVACHLVNRPTDKLYKAAVGFADSPSQPGSVCQAVDRQPRFLRMSVLQLGTNRKAQSNRPATQYHLSRSQNEQPQLSIAEDHAREERKAAMNADVPGVSTATGTCCG
jgi:hypothetical protein